MAALTCHLDDLNHGAGDGASLALTDIEKRWLALEGKTNPDFFLTWSWMVTWLNALDHKPYLLTISDEKGEDIAMGFISPNVEVRHKALRIKQLRLNTTGNEDQDVITIEYNSLLCASGHEKNAWRAAIEFLKKQKKLPWQELIISGATRETQNAISALSHSTHLRAEAGSTYVGLEALRENGAVSAGDYIKTLGKNTRSQIRRSIKLYSGHGPITLEHAKTIDEAEEFLDELSVHHNKKWQARGRKGALENPFYKKFHNTLISKCLPTGRVEIIRVRAGDYKFGWLYNFIHNGKVYFYLSGFRAEEDNRYKAGLVTHAMAIEHHLQNGKKLYDFMGGDNRYKTSLGQAGPEIVSFAIQKKSIALMAENKLRSAKKLLAK